MALAAIFTILVWWGSTQVLMWLVRIPSRWVLNGVALALFAASLTVAHLVSGEKDVAGVYMGFAAGIGLWAAYEITFLSGTVVGFEVKARGTGLLSRAYEAVCAILWHELVLIATLIGLTVLFWSAANPIPLCTFALLYVMRASAKVNLFLGARNLCTEFLPAHVAHLGKHFRKAPLNPLFGFSVLAGTMAAAFLLRAALDPSVEPASAAFAALLAMLTALGTLEHWLMLTPLSPLSLWSSQPTRVTLARPLGAAG